MTFKRTLSCVRCNNILENITPGAYNHFVNMDMEHNDNAQD